MELQLPDEPYGPCRGSGHFPADAIEPGCIRQRTRLGSFQRLPRHPPTDRAKTAELQPSADAPMRSTPIRAVLLTNADVDHVAGLLTLRERHPFTIYAAAQVLAVLQAISIFNALDPAIVARRVLPPEGDLKICDANGRATA
ncbi:MBL fold metallo-hydrolase [Mesorhizobium sp. M1066]|uniref:MBL fold metallo-hydrolase n=1 Tax=unclassified Mesorhizobium TaxID=325217 RepID=UPI003338B026